jgi:hypothetical protein
MLNELAAQGAGAADHVATCFAPDQRDHFPWGCPVAPLTAEISPTSPEVQRAFHDGLVHNFDALAEVVGGGADQDGVNRAIGILATLGGAMAMARATRGCDGDLSDRILTAAARFLASA